MTLKTIKNVDEETWYRFKTLAVKNKLVMGKLLEKMIISYESESNKFWKEVLEGDKILSDKEAKDLSEDLEKLRKEHGFRL
ncbi:hypothetical protein HYV79_00265 [Candidatus Woesearchaeota archaeon]|nr:hypothetical protein [Candidatus Woesearchaeota archaeon]